MKPTRNIISPRVSDTQNGWKCMLSLHKKKV